MNNIHSANIFSSDLAQVSRPSLDVLAKKYVKRLVGSASEAADKTTSNKIKSNKLVVINTSNRPWSVIDSELLFDALSGMEAIELFYSVFGRPVDASGSELDASMRIVKEERELLSYLVELNPSVIYLRVSPHACSEQLITLIRLQLPTVKLFIEFYDMSVLFDTATLDFILTEKNQSLDSAMEGCAVALYFCDGIVLKMGGERFNRWIDQFPVPVIPFFPSLSLEARMSASRSESQSSIRKALYAGSVSAREILGGMGSVDGANFLAYFDAFIGQEKISLDIVNGAHHHPEEDDSPKFKALMERYSNQQQVQYNRGGARDNVIRLARGFDMGICCAHYADDKVLDVTKFGLPNRMMTYLEAGLPVIIDDSFEYAGELIEKYHAGAVIPAGDIDAFIDCVTTINLNDAVAGVEVLRAAMIKENLYNLKQLDKVITKK